MPPRRPSTPPRLTADWRLGPRTAAWDALWERILRSSAIVDAQPEIANGAGPRDEGLTSGTRGQES